jgi:hypothetical protein
MLIYLVMMRSYWLNLTCQMRVTASAFNDRWSAVVVVESQDARQQGTGWLLNLFWLAATTEWRSGVSISLQSHQQLSTGLALDTVEDDAGR